MSASFNVTNLPKLRYGSTVDVQSAQVVDGTVLVDTSTWRMYVDLDGHRLDLNTPVPVATAANLPTQANRIPGKLYVALDTWTVYLSDGTQWHALEPWRYAAPPAGAAKGQALVAGSDSGSYAWGDKADLVDGKVPSSQLPVANQDTLGAMKVNSTSGVAVSAAQQLYVVKATSADIDARTNNYKPVVPVNLNYAVTAALTDSNHLTMTAEQQATAKSVLGVVDLPSGGTKGQVLVHGSDSGSYAWATIEGGGSSGGGAEYTPPLTFQFTSADIAGTLAWNAGHTEATVTHALPSVMLVQVLDADGALVQPDVTLASATTLKLGFGAEMDISDSSPWTATVYPAPGEPAAYADGNQY